MWSWKQPSDAAIEAFLARQSELAHSYPEVGCSLSEMPPGYDHDHNRVRLGAGQAVFDAGCTALRQWQMFPRSWTRIHPADTAIEAGRVVAMLARVVGLWWMNSCRIVAVIDETHSEGLPRRFGFAYGTLPGHVECGEERFMIQHDADGTVWYDLKSFSRPRYWPARLAYPIVRHLQRRFVLDSQASMVRAISETTGTTQSGMLSR